MEKPVYGLGERLLTAGLLTKEQLNKGLETQKQTGGLLGDILVKEGFLSAFDLSQFLQTSQFAHLGERLVEKKLITGSELHQALDYQTRFGGRLGDICITLGFLTSEQLEQVVSRSPKEKGMLGDTLLAKRLITGGQLEQALEMQKRSGGRLGEILVFMGYISEDVLYRELATQIELGRIGNDISLTNIKKLPYSLARKYHAMVVGEQADRFMIAVQAKLEEQALNELTKHLGKPVEQVLVSESENHKYWEALYRQPQMQNSVFELYDEQPENSAIVTFTSTQLAAFLALGLSLVVFFIADWRSTLFYINIFFQILYALMTFSKLFIVMKGERNNTQMKYSAEDLAAIDERKLPVYTLLIPVFKEKEVIGRLIENIQAFDYPKYKLDVRILLEEIDTETIEAINAMNLPPCFTPVIVPKSQPQTKPKACNYGLLQAKGEYVVIYDAEDRPEPDQLKKAYLAFQELPEEYVCIQAKLNYFNSNFNALTKLFTQEYSMWFELLLVGIMQMDIPIPLGGTSNHFKMSFLKEVGGWDPFNVTEDADLGIRLYKFRYKTAILDSRTWEEANSNIHNWIRQRSRWIKGYMQTWLVHMRHPVSFYKTVGFRGFLGYQAMILGTPLLPLVNPVFWLLMVLWYLTEASWIQGLFPGALYYIACLQLFAANFVFIYMNVTGMYHVIRDCAMKKKQPFSYGLIKYSLLTPLYWILMSIASYKALVQLIIKPFYWEKTVHGLTGDEHAQAAAGKESS